MLIPGASDRSRHLAPAAFALLGCLRSADGSESAAGAAVQPQVWDEMLALALRHGVAPLLHRALHSTGELDGLPPQPRARLAEERRATALDNLRHYGQFQRVAHALRDYGIPVIALKGLHLAELVYRDISLRPMADMDILVPRAQLEQTVSVLRGMDYGCAEDLAGAAAAMLDIKCNIGFAHRGFDVLLEVHWSLNEPPARYSAVLEDIWRSAVPASLGDADALIMSPEFLLLHVCAHLACNHTFAFSLHALCDITEILRVHPAIDWKLVVDHGRCHGWTRGVGAALRLASDYLGAAVPQEVFAALGADVLDSAMLAEAMEHLVACTDMPDELRTAPNLMALAGKHGPAEKFAAIKERIFLPRAELALVYGVPQNSARLAFCYVLRPLDLLRRYAASAWALSVADPKLAATAARHARLARWVNGA